MLRQDYHRPARRGLGDCGAERLNPCRVGEIDPELDRAEKFRWIEPVEFVNGPVLGERGEQFSQVLADAQQAHIDRRIVGIGCKQHVAALRPFFELGAAVAPDHRPVADRARAIARPLVGEDDVAPILVE